MEDKGCVDMELLNLLKQRALALEPVVFSKRYKGHYLLGRSEEPEEDEWSFATGIHTHNIIEDLAMSQRGREAAPTTYELWKVEKSERNAFKRRISVGRASNNDVVIRHATISKLHAHFHFGTLVKLDVRQSADLLLSDVGSTNGTQLNGKRLVVDRTAPVRPGDRVRFGDVSCVLHDEKSLYKELRSKIF